jgi:hypothetical protein
MDAASGWLGWHTIKRGGKSKMRKYMSTFWERVSSSTLCELVELFGDKVPHPQLCENRRDRVFNEWRTVWLFLGQILSIGQSCREALKKAQLWFYLGANDEKKTFHPIHLHIVRPDPGLTRYTWMK